MNSWQLILLAIFCYRFDVVFILDLERPYSLKMRQNFHSVKKAMARNIRRFNKNQAFHLVNGADILSYFVTFHIIQNLTLTFLLLLLLLGIVYSCVTQVQKLYIQLLFPPPPPLNVRDLPVSHFFPCLLLKLSIFSYSCFCKKHRGIVITPLSSLFVSCKTLTFQVYVPFLKNEI